MIDKIYTSGYEQSIVGDFIAAMKINGIKKIIDVRQLPISRKKGFSKNILRGLLEAQGIQYTHLKALGTPKEGRLAAKHGEHKRFIGIFARQMETPEAKADLEAAIDLVQKDVCCLLCYERMPQDCHRTVVVNAIAKRTGQKVIALDILTESRQLFVL